MKIYSYESNIKRIATGCYMVVLATSKKEALKFAKNHEGLTIGSKLKGSSKDIQYEIEDFMNIQSIELNKLLKNNVVEFSRR